MRVLLFSSLDSQQPFGPFARPFYLGKALAQEGLEVWNLCLDGAAVDYGRCTNARSPIDRVRALRRIVERWRPHVIYAHENLPAAMAIVATRGAPVVADFHSIPSIEWRGFASDAETIRSRLTFAWAGARAWTAEELVLRRASALIAAGEEVGAALRRRGASAQVVVIANGVRADLVTGPKTPSPYPAGAHAVAAVPTTATPANVAALEYLREVAGLLETDLVIHILGSEQGPEHDRLAYQGLQPSIKPWLEHAEACLLPYGGAGSRLFGGARNKLLDALACGQRIVTTQEGLRGLPAAADFPGVYVTLDDPAAFARALDGVTAADSPRIALDDTTREELGWPHQGAKLRDTLEAVLRSPHWSRPPMPDRP